MSGNEAVNVRAGRHTGRGLERELTLKNEHNLFVGLPQLWLPLGQSWLTLCLPASSDRSLAPICRKYIFYLFALFIC